MPPCDPEWPNAIPADHLSFMVLPLGTARSLTVQVIYGDGEMSDVLRFTPCEIA